MPHGPQIPLTPQTDERNFPRWVDPKDARPSDPGYPYPKMLTRMCTRADQDKWREKNKRRDQNTREEYFESAPPRIGSLIPIDATQELVDQNLADLVGAAVVAKDYDHEVKILKVLGLWDEPEAGAPKVVRIPLAAPVEQHQPVKQVRRRRRRKVKKYVPGGERGETLEEVEELE